MGCRKLWAATDCGVALLEPIFGIQAAVAFPVKQQFFSLKVQERISFKCRCSRLKPQRQTLHDWAIFTVDSNVNIISPVPQPVLLLLLLMLMLILLY